MTDRTADANEEPETEGHVTLRFRATEADQPQPAGGEGAETEGHAVVKFRASDAPAPGDEAEVEGHFIKDPEVEGHGVTPPPTAMQREEPEVAGHTINVRRPIIRD